MTSFIRDCPDRKGSVYRMRKICVLLLFSFLLVVPAAAFADGAVNVEVMTADGVSVVVLTPEFTVSGADVAISAAEEEAASFRMPKYLTRIEESAFEGIDAACVEISENVAYIGYHAFANCENLREFRISASVEEIDRDAMEGCQGVTVCGTTDTAKKFAEDAGFDYVDLNSHTDPTDVHAEASPVALPLVTR